MPYQHLPDDELTCSERIIMPVVTVAGDPDATLEVLSKLTNIAATLSY